MYAYDTKEEDIDEIYEQELVELKKILELFRVDVSEFDKIRQTLYYVQN